MSELTDRYHQIAAEINALDKRCFLSGDGHSANEVAEFAVAHSKEWIDGNNAIREKWGLDMEEWQFIRELMRVERLRANGC